MNGHFVVIIFSNAFHFPCLCAVKTNRKKFTLEHFPEARLKLHIIDYSCSFLVKELISVRALVLTWHNLPARKGLSEVGPTVAQLEVFFSSDYL